MTFDLTPVLEAIITLAVVVVTSIIVPLLKKKIGEEKFSELERWVMVAVQAAEQLFAGSGRGTEKLAYVEEFLASKGFNIDSESLRNLIEAAVYSLSDCSTLVEGIEIKEG